MTPGYAVDMSRDYRYTGAAYARVLSDAYGVPSISDFVAKAQRISGTRFTADQLIERRAPRDLYRVYDAVIDTLDAPGVDSVATPIASITELPGYTEYRGVAASDPIAKLKVAYLLAAAYRASDRGFTERKGGMFAKAALSLAEDGRHQGEEQGSARLIYGIADIYGSGLDVFRANANTISNTKVRTEIEQALRAGTDAATVRNAIAKSQDSAAALRSAKEDIEDEARKESFFQSFASESGSTIRWTVGIAAIAAVAVAAIVVSRRRSVVVSNPKHLGRSNPGHKSNAASGLFTEDQHPLPPAADAQRERVFAAMERHRTRDGA